MALARGLKRNEGAVLNKLMTYPFYSGLLLGLQWVFWEIDPDRQNFFQVEDPRHPMREGEWPL